MQIDIANLVSGIIGGLIALLGAFLIAYMQHRWTAKENAKKRALDMQIHQDQKRHDKDMQRRENNIRKTGIASMREIGGG
jgi:hypothetical protein